MNINPYESPAESVGAEAATGGRRRFSPMAKFAVCLIGLALYVSNPWRDLWYYEDVAAHEGFGTTADAYIIGFVGQWFATMLLFPAALFLIVYGIARSTRFSLRPRFDRFTWGWGVFASLLGLLMLLVEGDMILAGVGYRHHWDTVLISLAYSGFIYVWWCCSLAHGRDQPAQATWR